MTTCAAMDEMTDLPEVCQEQPVLFSELFLNLPPCWRGRGHPLSGTKETWVAPFASTLTYIHSRDRLSKSPAYVLKYWPVPSETLGNSLRPES